MKFASLAPLALALGLAAGCTASTTVAGDRESGPTMGGPPASVLSVRWRRLITEGSALMAWFRIPRGQIQEQKTRPKTRVMAMTTRPSTSPE